MFSQSRASSPRPVRGGPPVPMHFTRAMFMELDRSGVFGDDRVELIEGEIFIMAPMEEPHARPIQHITIALAKRLPEGFTFRCQLPFAAADDSQPQPDFTVFRADSQPEDDMPDQAVFIFEVSDSSLSFDLRRKSVVYSRAKVPEYWVLDVKKRELVVHRSPSGEKYRTVKRLTELSAVKSTAVPGLVLDLTNIFVKR